MDKDTIVGNSICLNIGGTNIHRQVAKLQHIQNKLNEQTEAAVQQIQTVIDFFQTVENENANAKEAKPSKMHAKETLYNGYRFRSRLEARWAVFFDAMGIHYEYEPEGLVLSDGTTYLPDFYLPQFNCFFEVKRSPQKIDRSKLPRDEFEFAIQKIKDGSFNDEWAGIIAFGDPLDHYMWIFCQEYNDNSGGSYEAPVVFGIDPVFSEPILFSWNDIKERTFLTSFSKDGKRILMVTDVGFETANNPYLTEKVINAETLARQARFEYGETPILNNGRN